MAAALTMTGLGALAPSAALSLTETEPTFLLNEADLEHILKQIQIAESNAAGNDLLCESPTDTSGKCVTDPALPLGLRTVDGSYNNLLNPTWGASDEAFPKLLPAQWRTGEAAPPDAPGNNPANTTMCEAGTTCYSMSANGSFVYDSEPRVISNLIVDQSTNNPAAVNAYEASIAAGQPATNENGQIFIPNTAPDEALSAPSNAWFTFFGQFFDHGLDLINKGGNGTVVVPLQPDDPLIAGDDGEFGTGDDLPPGQRFLMLTRATRLPGPDGLPGTADDLNNNQTTPFIDQNQTYTSSPSHQVFLREYRTVDGTARDTGRLLDGTLVGGGTGGLATWNDVKRQTREILGIDLVDTDVLNVPMLVTDLYGNFTPGPERGLPQLVMSNGDVVEGDTANPISTAGAVRGDRAFIDDIANGASPDKAGYDSVSLGEHFVTGDGRANENIGLTAVHQVFHAEHNRMVEEIEKILDKPENAELKKAYQGLPNNYQERMGEPLPSAPEADDWTYEQRLFQAAKFPTEMQYQHLVFEEFARRVQPAVDVIAFNENGYDATINPAISSEFANVVYRFGHSMLTEEIDRRLPGSDVQGVSLLDGFLSPRTFTENGTLTPAQASGAIVNGTVDQISGQIDEFVIDTLRNNLLGLPLDLATINLARARETGVPPLQTARRTFFEASGDPLLEPYTSWVDFGLSLKNGDNFGRDTNYPNASLVNFVAAYGTHPSVTAETTVDGKRAAAGLLVNGGPNEPADRLDFMNSTGSWISTDGVTITGLDDVDFWIGGLAEALEPFGGMLGSTFNYVFEKQMEDLQFGDRFYYLFRNQGNQLFAALEANSFASLIQRNTDASLLPSDIFSVQEPSVDLENLPTPLPAGLNVVNGQYRWDGDEHIEMFGNRTNADNMRGGQGDDSLWGYGGNDRIEGGSGNDRIEGGLGNDILTDSFGVDNIKGGWGNDAIRSGAGEDLIFPSHGDDFVTTTGDLKTIFAGTGDDVIAGGSGRDFVFAGEGDDWVQGGGHADLLQGDNANQFQNNPDGGNDVVDGGAANDDVEGEGGDDILIGRSAGTDRMEGMMGFDWVTYRGESAGVDVDLRFTTLQRPDVQAVRDRYDLVEGASGGPGDDVLRGLGRVIDDISLADLNANKMTQASLDLIGGLERLLDPGHPQNYADRFFVQPVASTAVGSNNLLLGGSGSDLIESRAGDDFVDGDAYLDVYLMADGVRYNDATAAALQDGIYNGSINPGSIDIVREVVTAPGQANVLDTAVYAGDSSQYTITDLGDGYYEVEHDPTAVLPQGADILRNVELVRFTDGCFVINSMTPCDEYGSASIAYTGAPTEDVPVTGSVTFNGLKVKTPTDVTFRWMSTPFEDIAGPQEWTTAAVQELDETAACTTTGGVLTCSSQFAPGDAEFGTGLRLEVTFLNGAGVLSSIVSPVTNDAVVGVNDAPTGLVLDTDSPVMGERIAASGLDDADGLPADGAGFEWSWQTSADGSAPWTEVFVSPYDAPGYLPTLDDVGRYLRVVAVYTDNQGTAESPSVMAANRVSEFAPVPDPTAPNAPSIGVSQPATNGVTVNWTAPANDGGSEITGYVIRTYANGVLQPGTVSAGAGDSSTFVSGLTNADTNYTFTVAAVNAIGTGAASGQSAPVQLLVEPGLSGVVSTGGAPLEGAVVNAFDPATNQWTPPATTDAAGAYTLPVTAGNWKLYVQPNEPGHSNQWYGGGDGTAVPVSGPTTVDVALIANPALTGTVTTGGAPLEGAVVNAFDPATNQWTPPATTDAAGAYTLPVTAGDWKLYVQPNEPGHSNQWYGGGSGTVITVSGPTTVDIAL